MRIGIDMDGVVMDFVSAFHREAENLFQRKFPTWSSDWDFTNWGMTPDEYKRLWQKVIDTPDWFYSNERPLNLAMEGLHSLSGHELYFITTRTNTKGTPVLRQTQMQLDDLGIKFPTVIVRKDKGPVIAGLDLDVYVDDYEKNLTRVEECSPYTKLFLMNQTYNTAPVPPSWTRVASLREFAEVVQ